MNFFRITPSFRKTASDYITRDAVEHANELLMGRRVEHSKNQTVDVYTRHNIKRPTIKQISEAGSMAMRAARLEKVS